MTMRPLASGFSGWRISRAAMAPSSIGTTRSRRPNAPVISISTRSPTGPRRSDQVPAAMISAMPSSSRARPSLRCAGSRFFAPRPTPRNIAPTACARPSHSARTSRKTPFVGDGAGFGAGLGAAFFAGARFAGAFFAGAAAFLAGAFFAGAFFAGAFLAVLPGRPARCFEVPAVLWEPLPDVREAMVVRLPLSAARDTCVYAFTRSCRVSAGLAVTRRQQLSSVRGPYWRRCPRRAPARPAPVAGR